MTPLELEILIHCYVCSEPFPRAHAPAVEEATDRFVAHGIIESAPGNRCYMVTEKGGVWLKIILRTPMPKAVWMDAQGNIVSL